ILGAIGALMVTHFLYHGYHIAAELGAGAGAPGYMPVSSFVGESLAPLSPEEASRGATFGYWLHVLILLTFLNYLPYSKHIHLLGADDGPAEAEPRGRDAVGRREVRAVLVEEPARHVRVHGVRALHELLPGLQHRQEPVADAAHPRHPLRDARPDRGARSDRRRRERGQGPRGDR